MGNFTEVIAESKVNTHGIKDVDVRTLSTGDVKSYRVKNGTYYHATTSDQVINALERIRHNKYRVKLDLGDPKTGISWNEVYDVTGYVSRSMGEIQIPILVNNARSTGGGGILDHCIISIKHSNKANGGFIYKNPKCKT